MCPNPMGGDMDTKDIRFFVEKIDGCDGEARELHRDIQETLGIPSVTQVHWYNFYEISGLTPKEAPAVIQGICSEPQVDRVYSTLPETTGTTIAREALPGQFDQRADSAAQCIQLMFPHWSGEVKSGQVIRLDGTLSKREISTIQSFLINPVESRVKDLSSYSLRLAHPTPERIPQIDGFITWHREKLQEWYSSQGFAMSFEDLLFCQKFFKDSLNRNPFETEIRVIDTYWSDHCRHTTFETEIRSISFPKGALGDAMEKSWNRYKESRKNLGREAKPVTLMDLATMGAREMRAAGKLDDWDVSDEINACTIEVEVTTDDGVIPYYILFKNETHNHPTEIEPFGGAATCIGGAIRDPLSGRAYVYQAMRVTGSGDPRESYEDTLNGKLPQKTITTTAAKGYSSYGNQIGLATSLVKEIYHPGYRAKRMEVGAVVGAVPKDQVRREQPAPGDVIILVGGKTGRDGCGGATGSSKSHTKESLATCGAEVQKGNPPEERKIQRLFRNPEASMLIKRCNDFGAGGVCVAIGEIAESLEINLDKVPVKYVGLNGTELAISESQERMAIVVDPKDVSTWMKLSKQENLESTVVAEVTDSGRLVMTWKHNIIVDIPRSFLDTNGVRRDTMIEVPTPEETYFESPLKGYTPGENLKRSLGSLESCSQRGLSEQFDASIGGGTVLMPYGGRYQLTEPEASVHLVPVASGATSSTATVMAPGFDPKLSTKAPYLGAQYAVIESIGRVVAAGSDWKKTRLSLQEYFPSLGNSPRRWGLPASAVLGAYEAQRRLGIPAIGGKDSMSGSFHNLHIPPTLISFGLATTEVSRVKSPEFKEPGEYIYLLHHTPEPSGFPNYDQLEKNWNWVVTHNSIITAALSVKGEGVPVGIAQMSRGNKIGAAIEGDTSVLEAVPGSIIVTTKEALPEESGITLIGRTTAEKVILLGDEQLSVDELIEIWKKPLQSVFPDYHDRDSKEIVLEQPTKKRNYSPTHGTPRVIIPVFPGTNCEYDSLAAFARAGADPSSTILRNQSSQDITDSIGELVQHIQQSQILMLPGGFSAGDEPDGSGKFIANILRNPRVAEAIYRLLDRDGLILGVCNGFQALLKSGLLPYGQIGVPAADAPTLTHNSVHRHISRILDTKVLTENSPWLYGLKGKRYNTPVSHGEGRFFASQEALEELIHQGQVALQYVNQKGEASMNPLYNPNGSVGAVEGIISADGKILGKMGHIERFHRGAFSNVPETEESPIITNGVKYFL